MSDVTKRNLAPEEAVEEARMIPKSLAGKIKVRELWRSSKPKQNRR